MHHALTLTLQAKLSRKYGITEIPTLVMLNAKNGQLVTLDGKLLILEDPAGNRFPWRELDFLGKANYTNWSNDIITWGSITERADVLGVFFSVSIVIVEFNINL